MSRIKSEKQPKRGRPEKEIPVEKVLQLAVLGAKNTEIADFFGCDEGVIRKRFQPQLVEGRAQRKMKIRKWQWDSAEAGNVTMQIWLGKNELGQSEKTDLAMDGKVTVEVVYRQPNRINAYADN